jgi:hypothetical protein
VAEEIKAPYYSYEDLRRKADEFLAKYHPAGTIPVPIEEIIEFQFRIDIVPTPGLHQLLETDGFITSDLREIRVDQFVYERWSDSDVTAVCQEILGLTKLNWNTADHAGSFPITLRFARRVGEVLSEVGDDEPHPHYRFYI